MIQLTLGQSLVVISSVAAAWLMIRAGAANRRLEVRVRPRCAFCGRTRTAKICACGNASRQRR
jgi:hypothetical protein